jgi:hypothetical protein
MPWRSISDSYRMTAESPWTRTLIGEIGFQAVYMKAEPESMYASLDSVSPEGLMSSKSSACSF